MTTPQALPVYDWTYPALLQNWDWDCSEEATRWCLHAYGRTPDDSWMEQSMIAAGVVTPEVGCTDASGAGLAGWVNDQYGEYGYLAENDPEASFDELAAEASTHAHPIAIGGRGWYHWSGLRGYDALLDRLELANPAPGYRGVYQVMSRAQFAELGPFSLVRVTHPEAEGAVTPTTAPFGPDVSSHQGAVDWMAVRAAGSTFGFTKATGGAWYVNPTLAANWAGMAAAGLQRGAYHYAFESSGQPWPGPGPEAEADAFLDRVLPLGLDAGDMLALDIEEGAGPLGDWALRWCRRVEHTVGFRPLVYTGTWFADPHGFGGVPELAEYPLWLAAYQAAAPAPCAPWPRVAFWQFTDRAPVPGISGPCDGNRFLGTPAELAAIGKPAPGARPDDPYAPWRGLVGSGLLQMMAADNTVPAQACSTWLPLGKSPADIEACTGQNGVDYRWLVSTTNTGYRYRPAT